MEELEERVRQLELALIASQFINGLLIEKYGVTIDEMKNFAAVCLEGLPDSERNSDIYHYLTGVMRGEVGADILNEKG